MGVKRAEAGGWAASFFERLVEHGPNDLVLVSTAPVRARSVRDAEGKVVLEGARTPREPEEAWLFFIDHAPYDAEVAHDVSYVFVWENGSVTVAPRQLGHPPAGNVELEYYDGALIGTVTS